MGNLEMHEMKVGINIRNTDTQKIGVALEYCFTSYMMYRYTKSPNCVEVELPDGKKEVWLLSKTETA